MKTPDLNEYTSAEHALKYLTLADRIPHRTEGESVLLESGLRSEDSNTRRAVGSTCCVEMHRDPLAGHFKMKPIELGGVCLLALAHRERADDRVILGVGESGRGGCGS